MDTQLIKDNQELIELLGNDDDNNRPNNSITHVRAGLNSITDLQE